MTHLMPAAPAFKERLPAADCHGRMHILTRTIPSYDQAERQWQITAAFFENVVSTTTALEALVGRMYRHDPDSLAHLHRVAHLSGRIGLEMGLAPDQIDDLERAALVHDVGRLIMLTPEPWPTPAGTNESIGSMAMTQRVEQVRLARDVMSDVPFLRRAAVIVESSLECFDGTGQPRGLRGVDIPIGARILAVADAVDALTSVCLALQCSTDMAASELMQRTGARFDPDVVSAWLRGNQPSAMTVPAPAVSTRWMN
ncbi:MAG: HD domain-containing protein [Acidobacteria bacterium]|nr:HD domain-containing protein [Acidobacteriota bacterium]